MADLLALADRVEKAAAESRELDHEIHASVVAPHLYDHIMWPSYTTSLDAAKTLAPEGAVWDVASTGVAWIDVPGSLTLFTANGNTPAAGLSAAALRARANNGSAT